MGASRNEKVWGTSTVVDQAAVDHETLFGGIPASGETVRVRVTQRVEYDLLTDPIEIKVHPVWLHIGDSEFALPQAREALEAFAAAVRFAEEIERPDPEG